MKPNMFKSLPRPTSGSKFNNGQSAMQTKVFNLLVKPLKWDFSPTLWFWLVTRK